jgi:RNA polymerase sigma factor (sigma-70 family)
VSSPKTWDEPRAAVLASAAARKRVAVETYARNEAALKRLARRYSICADDAEDAVQRGLEILLRKAPSEDPRELIRWTQTVVKHEALALRRERERELGNPGPANSEPGREDWVALLPSDSDGPPEQAERHEQIARSREALRTLKPQELRALTLLAEGYSYREIEQITGFSQTKINRCLAEGRARFRQALTRSADGSRCAELSATLSAYCDGQAGADDVAAVREHLHACPVCRATLRAYRAAPAAAAALVPTLPLGRTLFSRLQDTLAGLAGRFGAGGGGTSDSLAQVASGGGARGAGLAALAKAAAVCAGAVGGAACVATGVVTPLGIGPDPSPPARVVHHVTAPPLAAEPEPEAAPTYEIAPQPAAAEAPTQDDPPPAASAPHPTPEPEASAGAVEFTPPPAPNPTPPPEPSGSDPAGDAAGEFGP